MSLVFRLPLPPTTNHAYKIGVRYEKGKPRARLMATPELEEWRDCVAVLLMTKYGSMACRLPPQTPLAVSITLEVPKRLLRKVDADGYLKPLLDMAVGSRCDQYIDHLEVRKVIGDGYAVVTVDTLERALQS